jgi:putative transposase
MIGSTRSKPGVLARVRGLIEGMLAEKLSGAVASLFGRRKPPADDAAASLMGARHDRRERRLTGTFGKTHCRAARRGCSAKTARHKNDQERSASCLPAAHAAIVALIARALRAGTSNHGERRALNAVFAGSVGKDAITRVWSKVNGAGTYRETAAMLLRPPLALGQITMHKVDGSQSLAEKPNDQIVDLAA